jgi:hypothetical protein
MEAVAITEHPSMTKTPKRPRDPAQLAKMIVDIATGEIEDKADTGLTKRARAGGKKGGAARSLALSSDQKSEIARTAAQARWKKS